MDEADFKDALSEAGLAAKESIIADGNFHRFYVEGDRTGSRNGWYIFYSDGIPAGSFGSWRTGQVHSWSARSFKTLSPQEKANHKRRMDEAQKKREAEEEKRRSMAREKAQSIWVSSSPASNMHAYLVKKGVKSYGIKVFKESLVVPMRDTGGVLHSLQFIDDKGGKRFLSGGRKRGCYFAIGVPTDTLCIAEGYATAARIYEATGHACAVSFDAGNLSPVAKALRSKFPEMEITLCADNDANTQDNPGVTKAREAAASVGALLSVPPIVGDFNDFFRGLKT